MSASEKAKKPEEEGAISASKPKTRKVELDEDDREFECYNKSDGEPVHVDIDKKVTDGGPPLALLLKKLEEEEINYNSETTDGDGNISAHKSNRMFKPPDRLGSVP